MVNLESFAVGSSARSVSYQFLIQKNPTDPE